MSLPEWSAKGFRPSKHFAASFTPTRCSDLENEAKRRDEQKALDALVAGTNFEYPAVLVEREIDRMIREQTNFGNQKQAMQRYLAQIGKTEEEYRDTFRPDATERVKRSLASVSSLKSKAYLSAMRTSPLKSSRWWGIPVRPRSKSERCLAVNPAGMSSNGRF